MQSFGIFHIQQEEKSKHRRGNRNQRWIQNPSQRGADPRGWGGGGVWDDQNFLKKLHEIEKILVCREIRQLQREHSIWMSPVGKIFTYSYVSKMLTFEAMN